MSQTVSVTVQSIGMALAATYISHKPCFVWLNGMVLWLAHHLLVLTIFLLQQSHKLKCNHLYGKNILPKYHLISSSVTLARAEAVLTDFAAIIPCSWVQAWCAVIARRWRATASLSSLVCYHRRGHLTTDGSSAEGYCGDQTHIIQQ